MATIASKQTLIGNHRATEETSNEKHLKSEWDLGKIMI